MAHTYLLLECAVENVYVLDDRKDMINLKHKGVVGHGWVLHCKGQYNGDSDDKSKGEE